MFILEAAVELYCFILRNVSNITSSMIISESKLNITNISYFIQAQYSFKMTQLNMIKTSLKQNMTITTFINGEFIAVNVGCKLYVYYAIILWPKFCSH